MQPIHNDDVPREWWTKWSGAMFMLIAIGVGIVVHVATTPPFWVTVAIGVALAAGWWTAAFLVHRYTNRRSR